MGRAMHKMNLTLGLRANEWAEVKSLSEILATLDGESKCEGLPFMPEMARHCGKQYRVFKRADKTCDNINGTWMLRRMYNTVLLESLRCDGDAHGGCQAGCMLFWKEAWLKRIKCKTDTTELVSVNRLIVQDVDCQSDRGYGSDQLFKATRAADSADGKGDCEVYRCQGTELHKATYPISRWDFLQYVRDLASCNVDVGEFIRGIAIALFNGVQRIRGALTFPYVEGSLKATPKTACDLQAGELVRIKPLDDIVATLDVRNRNRGLLFDLEMANFCGGTFRIKKRVEKIINERTGEMIRLPNDCLILEGVSCVSQVHSDRLFCPRRIYAYWRGSWLERA